MSRGTLFAHRNWVFCDDDQDRIRDRKRADVDGLTSTHWQMLNRSTKVLSCAYPFLSPVAARRSSAPQTHLKQRINEPQWYMSSLISLPKVSLTYRRLVQRSHGHFAVLIHLGNETSVAEMPENHTSLLQTNNIITPSSKPTHL